MGVAAAQFFQSENPEESLHYRLTPTDSQVEQQQKKRADVDHFICEYIKRATGLPVRTWIQGSYKMLTQIRPVACSAGFDMDLGVCVGWSKSPADELSPSELKRLVRRAAVEFGGAGRARDIQVQSKEKCERLIFPQPEVFHIDLPSYHIDDVTDRRRLATAGGWIDSDPKPLVVWFQERVRACHNEGQLRRLVRYVKAMALLQIDEAYRPSSIAWTVLVATCISDGDPVADDEAFVHILRRVAACLSGNSQVRNPINPSENLNVTTLEKAARLAARLSELVAAAEKAADMQSTGEASIAWATLFRHFFPLAGFSANQRRSGTLHGASPQVGGIDIAVTARPKDSREGKTFKGRNLIGPVPKNYEITFQITTPLPPMAEVEWTVRNRGNEAEAAGDLGHVGSHDDRGRSTMRTTRYNGNHSMDCVVREAGRVIRVARVTVFVLEPR
ncbi:MAG: hypothetical protein HQ464_01300 [Planctomycetes bacterium]|nr:hypothetical protein [Planctomycetota bacterium]